MKAQAGAISTTQGLVDYANAQHPDVPTYDVVTEYNAVMSEIDNALAWIAANIPADGSGYELVYQRNPDGSKVYREFTPAQTTGLRTTLSAIEALIE